MTDINDIKAGEYVLVALRWDQITSKPGEPLDFVRHRQGDRVKLNVEDARRLVLAGAVKAKGDDQPTPYADAPSTPPGESGQSGGDQKPPVSEAPSRHTIADVKAYVDKDPEKAAAVLALEQGAGDPRPTLVKWLEELATKPADPDGSGNQGGSVNGSGQD